MCGRRWRTVGVVAGMLPAFLLPPTLAQPASVRTVLAIYWSTEDFSGAPALAATIRETLLSRPDLPLDYFAEYLESDRFPPALAEESLADYIQRKYQGRRIDAVIAITDPALQFALRYRPLLFPDAPIVATTRVADAQVRAPGIPLTGLNLSTAFGETLRLALNLHPGTQRVFVIAHSPGQRMADSIRPELQAAGGGVDLSFIDESSLPGLVEAVKAVPPEVSFFTSGIRGKIRAA